MKADLVPGKVDLQGGRVHSSAEGRDLSPRQKVEETLTNLAAALGYKQVKRICMQDRSKMYAVDEEAYQRGTNLILDLSRKLLERQA